LLDVDARLGMTGWRRVEIGLLGNPRSVAFQVHLIRKRRHLGVGVGRLKRQSGRPFALLRTWNSFGPPSMVRCHLGYPCRMVTLLWLIAVVFVIAGIFGLVRGQLLWGLVLIVLGLAVGPGGYSIFR